jgi:PBP1b-binding outer membrane lipoprotein LpoB
MKGLIGLGFTIALFLFSCKNQPATSENDVDAARNFIHSVLNSDFNQAEKYIFYDSANREYLNITERSFRQRLSAEERRLYRESSINIHDIRQMNDSTTIVQYSNSYKKLKDSLKVIRHNGQWLVDLKYSFPSMVSEE